MTAKHKHIFIIAGEASGDLHAASLVNELQKNDSTLTFSGIGGKHMLAAGVKVIHPLANYGVTGFSEVISQFKEIKKAFRLAQAFLNQHRIDLVILIDYPGFNLRFAKFAKRNHHKVLYYISPQIWAWKQKRIKTIERYVDTMALILPFEKAIYQKANLNAYFVGHPLAHLMEQTIDSQTFLTRHQLHGKTLIGLMPGSRPNEIKRLMPVIIESAEKLLRRYPNMQFILPLASSIDEKSITRYTEPASLPLSIVREQHYEAIKACHSLIVASGTATLEVSLLNKPFVIIYKTSRLSYTIAMQVIKSRYIGLCNLLANRLVIPELIQDDLTSEHVANAISSYLDNPQYYEKTTHSLKQIGKMLENNAVDCRLSDLVVEALATSK